ncbi:aminoacyl-histidine dipeptidase [Telmatospirillum siberiense]|uniref:Cytosol non-specific dipeptidase n=1 Tax=Telmatospirillum siberiense TaxID=382514 RepID=A0A2N3PXC7_9PROT|nr:aminoacyl-histidine dipeptidase [Telmatospirillum siberiense]PKU25047.1 cytosol nonspecific dipeptidase [Telmatospirillum siberiense]
MTAIAHLHPALVWKHFATLCEIPRPSKQETALRRHMADWAEARGLAATIDSAGNLLIRKAASRGRGDRLGVVLQAHLDMVCQANSGTVHDFTRDPIRPVERDGWLTAPDTTLGADNGIGVALALAALEDETLEHPPLEVLLTVDEEAGMGGARGLPPGLLTGRKMLNLDTEEWGEFYLGCAGGCDVAVIRHCRTEAVPEGYDGYRLRVHGLRGGHSGVDIHLGRGNANKLLIRVLRRLEKNTNLRLAAMSGGTARNALPREAWADIALPGRDAAGLASLLADLQALFRAELAGVDEAVAVEAVPATVSAAISLGDQSALLAALHAAPHGVRRMSADFQNVVETSDNLGLLSLSDGDFSASLMVRSLRSSGTEMLADEIVSLFTLAGCRITVSGEYPGWTPNPHSALLALCQDVYAREFGADANVQVIHAGLECGIIGAKYPEIDTVSFGPTIRGAHAPGERVEIASVDRSWRLLKAILAEI